MLPRNLHAGNFDKYPNEARSLAVSHLATLQRLPLSVLPALLAQVIEYDFKFPAERAEIDAQLATLGALSPRQFAAWVEPFETISLSSRLTHVDWVNHPAKFLEEESSWLWTTGQQDAFRRAATEYGDRIRAASPRKPLAQRRLGIAVIGQGVASWDAPLFQYLRPHGTYFSQVKPDNGLRMLLEGVASRAAVHPVPYGHWYVDGGQAAESGPSLTCMSYAALHPLRTNLLRYIQQQVRQPGDGPEALRTDLARLTPARMGMPRAGNEVMEHFQLSIFTEGSGTQIFSTTFAQWTAREALRRAQPLTLMVRFAPRQRQRPMDELLSNSRRAPELDPAGSLVDADMGAWYHWLNQQRLPGADDSAFLAWFEDHNQAVVIGPTLPRGTESNSSLTLAQLLSLALG